MNSLPLSGMKAANRERKLFQHLLQNRNQPAFRDLGRGRHNLPLRHFVDRVDVIQTLDAVAVAPMHGVDAQISRTPLRLRFAPLADRYRRGPGGLITGVTFAVRLGIAEPVNLRHRDLRQALEGRLTIVVILALQNPLRRRTAQIAVALVHIGEQFHIRPGVAGGEFPPLIRSRLYLSAGGIACDQPRHLRPAQSRHAGDIPPHQSLFHSAEACVLETNQRPFRPAVYPGPTLPGESYPSGALQKRPNLLQTARLRIVHADNQFPASRFPSFMLILCENPTPASGSSCVRQEWHKPKPVSGENGSHLHSLTFESR